MLISAVQKFTMLDYPDHTAAIVFTPGCNMRCKFCHNKEFVLPNELEQIADSFLKEEAILRFLDTRKGLLDGIVISGGEPTLQKDLRTFIEKVRTKGFLVKLDTNGQRPEVVKELLTAHLLDYIAMDVKTLPQNYNDLVGAGDFEKTIPQSIEVIQKSGIAYEFRTTMIKEIHTPEIIEEMINLLAGSEKYYIQTFRPKNTLDPTFEKYHPFEPSEMKEICQKFAEVVDEVGVRG